MNRGLTMFPVLLLGALLLDSPAHATGDACSTGGVQTTTLVFDLQNTISQLLPLPDLWREPVAPPPADDCAASGRPGACAARRSVIAQTERHERLLEETGVGAWYGDGNAFEILSPEERQTWVDSQTKPGSAPRRAQELKRGSCIEWAMEHVRAYYEAIGERETWERIEATVRGEKLTGTSLARELKAAGWRTIYLNADTSYQGADGQDTEHVYSRAVVDSKGSYYGTRVDESILDWEQHPERLAGIEQQPFFVYVARGGLHVTAGVDGAISELARGEGPADKLIYQDRLRDIIGVYTDDVHGGGEEGRHAAMRMWGSGMVLLPPGSQSGGEG
jgi:hypothetical protein